ncbi:PQQ-binding-like beta-propeller repeat protein [Cellulosimicrobium cellulans]|uniref:outer membrane protein assembly factor BamB family protein n=1 Tax=Cellulosimicrobium cellulans TaxID=1710 RepID=UPI0036EB2195
MPRPRRVRPRDRLTFALEDDAPDLDPDHGAESGPVPAGHPASPSTADGATTDETDRTAPARRRRARTALATVGVAAAVVVGMVVVDTMAARPSIEALRRSPGGVLPVATAPSELWRVPGPTWGGIATLPGLLVVVRDDEATAYDLDTGSPRWSVDVPAGSACGDPLVGTERGTTVPGDTLVCLTSDGPTLTTASPTGLPLTGPPTLVAGEPAVVTVLDASGAVVATRTLDAARGWSSVGPDGTVARFRRVGGDPGGRLVDVDPASGRPTDLSGGLDVIVTLEDAATGDILWEHELPFVGSEAGGGCQQYGTEDGTTFADLDGGRLDLVQGELLVAHGCGVEAWFSHDGARLDDPRSSTDGLVALPDGSLARDPDDSWNGGWTAGDQPVTVTPALLDPDGTVLWEAPGPILVPYATDGSADELLLVRRPADLEAYDAAGTPRWTSSAASAPLLVYAVAGGTVVALRDTDSALVGIDVETGHELWSLTPNEVRAIDEGRGGSSDDLAPDVWFSRILTDGDRAFVVVASGSGSASRVVALDLHDGRVAWRGDATSAVTYLAVQGRLLRVDDSTVARLG